METNYSERKIMYLFRTSVSLKFVKNQNKKHPNSPDEGIIQHPCTYSKSIQRDISEYRSSEAPLRNAHTIIITHRKTPLHRRVCVFLMKNTFFGISSLFSALQTRCSFEQNYPIPSLLFPFTSEPFSRAFALSKKCVSFFFLLG